MKITLIRYYFINYLELVKHFNRKNTKKIKKMKNFKKEMN